MPSNLVHIRCSSIKEVKSKVLDFLNSNSVRAILYVKMWPSSSIEPYYESDRFSVEDYSKKGKKMSGFYAKKHKIEGLYFLLDAQVSSAYHLPPGLTGVKEAFALVKGEKSLARVFIDVLLEDKLACRMKVNFKNLKITLEDFSE